MIMRLKYLSFEILHCNVSFRASNNSVEVLKEI